MIKEAIAHALKNPIKKRGRRSISRMASVLTDGTNTYYGMNSWKTHPLMKRFCKHEEAIVLHSEIDAIKNAIRDGVRDFRNYRIYTARVLRSGEPALAKPCSGCARAIIHFSLRSAEWTK